MPAEAAAEAAASPMTVSRFSSSALMVPACREGAESAPASTAKDSTAARIIAAARTAFCFVMNFIDLTSSCIVFVGRARAVLSRSFPHGDSRKSPCRFREKRRKRPRRLAAVRGYRLISPAAQTFCAGTPPHRGSQNGILRCRSWLPPWPWWKTGRRTAGWW